VFEEDGLRLVEEAATALDDRQKSKDSVPSRVNITMQDQQAWALSISTKAL